MPKYRVYGKVVGTKYIGEFEAATKEEAEQMAWENDEAYVSVCHQCSRDIEDPEIERMEVIEVE
jgi:hypothetical protein